MALIKAAPDLLGACKELLEWVEEPLSGDWDTPRGKAITDACAAIAKATEE